MPSGRRQDKHGRRAVTFAAAALSSAVALADPSDPPPSVTTVTPPPTTRPTAKPVDEIGGDGPLPTTPGDHKLKFRTHVGGKVVQMTYLLHLPPRYETDGPDQRSPMLVFLHGSGESGSDLAGVYAWGPPSLLKKDTINPVFAASCPFIVLAPQCPPRGQRWDMDFMTEAVAVLVDGTIRRARVDPDRVYVTGLSMGALGTWCLAELTPDRFAAIAPMNGFGFHPERAGPLLRTVPVWASVGLNDEPKFVDATRTMDAALAGAPVARRFCYLIGNGHDAFWPTYQDPDFYEWLLTHRRPSPAAREALAAAPPPPVDTPLPTDPGLHFGTWDTKVADQPYPVDFVTYLPKGYTPGKRYPTMLFLREADTIGPDFNDICLHGPNLALARTPSLQDGFPFIVISPHMPVKCDWQTPGMTATLLGLLDHLSPLGIDRDRVTVTGVDAGANGAWKLVAEAPDRFAAVMPIETHVPLPVTDDQMAAVERTVPGRAYVIAGDGASAARVAKWSAGHDWKVTELPPSATALGELSAYTDPAVLSWLAAQVRPASPASANAAK
jgi:predicted peptidase